MTKNVDSEGRRPDPVDIHVGKRVRLRRKSIGVSQEQVADALGLTFQQIQKYENGANRVSASKLHGIGKFLGVPVSFFFEGLEETADGQIVSSVETLFAAEGGSTLASDFLDLPRASRLMVLNLASSLAAQHAQDKVA